MAGPPASLIALVAVLLLTVVYISDTNPYTLLKHSTYDYDLVLTRHRLTLQRNFDPNHK